MPDHGNPLDDPERLEDLRDLSILEAARHLRLIHELKQRKRRDPSGGGVDPRAVFETQKAERELIAELGRLSFDAYGQWLHLSNDYFDRVIDLIRRPADGASRSSRHADDRGLVLDAFRPIRGEANGDRRAVYADLVIDNPLPIDLEIQIGTVEVWPEGTARGEGHDLSPDAWIARQAPKSPTAPKRLERRWRAAPGSATVAFVVASDALTSGQTYRGRAPILAGGRTIAIIEIEQLRA